VATRQVSVRVSVGVAPCYKNLHAKSKLSSFYSFRDHIVHTDGQADGHG